jgi:hypothetical protein
MRKTQCCRLAAATGQQLGSSCTPYRSCYALPPHHPEVVRLGALLRPAWHQAPTAQRHTVNTSNSTIISHDALQPKQLPPVTRPLTAWSEHHARQRRQAAPLAHRDPATDCSWAGSCSSVVRACASVFIMTQHRSRRIGMHPGIQTQSCMLAPVCVTPAFWRRTSRGCNLLAVHCHPGSPTHCSGATAALRYGIRYTLLATQPQSQSITRCIEKVSVRQT